MSSTLSGCFKEKHYLGTANNTNLPNLKSCVNAYEAEEGHFPYFPDLLETLQTCRTSKIIICGIVVELIVANLSFPCNLRPPQVYGTFFLL